MINPMHEDPYYRESLAREGCRHFRLRNGKTIVGYMQERTNMSRYYSRDNFWWRNAPIAYEAKDRSTEIFDVNRVMIFEHDVVRVRPSDKNDYMKVGVIEWDDSLGQLAINFVEEGGSSIIHPLAKDAPMRNDIRVTGQMFMP